MAIKQYTASADTTITNAYKANLRTRGVSGNMGESDILEVFSIYGQANTSSSELSRVLIKFPIDSIITDRTNSLIPTSGSVNFYLRLYNAKHNTTVPKNSTFSILAASGSWDEGTGLDMEEYSDNGTANWNVRLSSSSGTSSWVSSGGDYYASPEFTYSFNDGTEDILLNVTSLVEQWITGSKQNDGFLIKLTSSFETAQDSYYTKRFFARGTEFFFKRPKIEARWNSAKKDQRGSFYVSSSLSDSNINTIYLYNIIRGKLRNIPSIGTGAIYVKVFDDPVTGSQLSPTPNNPVTGGWYSTGIYTASFALYTTASEVFDRWYDSSLSTCFYTGSIDIKELDTNEYDVTNNYVISLVNSKPTYSNNETARFRFYIRNKDWNPTIYTVATTQIDTLTIESASFKIVRASDNSNVIDYGTGSDLHTMLSYDEQGNYFDLDMSMLEPEYKYKINLSFYDSQTNSWKEQKESFNFRVTTNES